MMKLHFIFIQLVKLIANKTLIILIGCYSCNCFAEDPVNVFYTQTDIFDFIPIKNPEHLQQFKQRPRLDKGIFLIAGQNLDDPNFSKTVILITDYNNEGTAGLVINRQTDIPVDQAFPNVEELMATTDNLYLGGPVDINRISLYHNWEGWFK